MIQAGQHCRLLLIYIALQDVLLFWHGMRHYECVAPYGKIWL